MTREEISGEIAKLEIEESEGRRGIRVPGWFLFGLGSSWSFGEAMRMIAERLGVDDPRKLQVIRPGFGHEEDSHLFYVSKPTVTTIEHDDGGTTVLVGPLPKGPFGALDT